MTIQMGEFINVGKYYHSRCGNVVKLFDSYEKVVGDKRLTEYKGQIVETIEGHQILKGKTHIFNEKGKWVKNPGGIHDLVKLCTHHS